MAVGARHSENVELHDYRNDTSTIIPIIINVEIDPQNKSICEDLLQTKTKEDTLKILQSGRPLKVVAGCLGMLCFILLAGNIVQAVLFNNNLNQLKTDYKNAVQHLKCQVADESCPSGWKRFGCSCYYGTTERKTWQKSREACLNQGADLVIINSREEQELIGGFKDLKRGIFSWIGLNKTEGRWTWVDETPLTTQYWWFGNDDEDRNCAASTSRGTWFNQLCSDTYTSICEK